MEFMTWNMGQKSTVRPKRMYASTPNVQVMAKQIIMKAAPLQNEPQSSIRFSFLKESQIISQMYIIVPQLIIIIYRTKYCNMKESYLFTHINGNLYRRIYFYVVASLQLQLIYKEKHAYQQIKCVSQSKSFFYFLKLLVFLVLSM